jgi:chemotaxis protein MotA
VDLATLIGLFGAAVIIAASIALGDGPLVFVNVPSALIVFAGSLFVVLAKFSVTQFLAAVSVAARAFTLRLPSTEEAIAEILEVAQVARRQGVLALESRTYSSPYFGAGLRLLIDGSDRDTVQQYLERERVLTLDHNRWGEKVFRAFGDVGPAMGMIGTLVGLVQMLSNMSDPQAIGPAMAVALLTTLYGAVLATMVCIPIADKLNLRMSEEARLQLLWTDAVLAIQSGTNPHVVEQLLSSYLPADKKAARKDKSEAEAA